MEIQVAINYIKKKNKNDDILKAFLCHELALKSKLHGGNVLCKKRPATKRFQDWIQYDNYPPIKLRSCCIACY